MEEGRGGRAHDSGGRPAEEASNARPAALLQCAVLPDSAAACCAMSAGTSSVSIASPLAAPSTLSHVPAPPCTCTSRAASGGSVEPSKNPRASTSSTTSCSSPPPASLPSARPPSSRTAAASTGRRQAGTDKAAGMRTNSKTSRPPLPRLSCAAAEARAAARRARKPWRRLACRRCGRSAVVWCGSHGTCARARARTHVCIRIPPCARHACDMHALCMHADMCLCGCAYVCAHARSDVLSPRACAHAYVRLQTCMHAHACTNAHPRPRAASGTSARTQQYTT